MDRGTWQATVHRVSKSQAGLSDYTHAHFPSSILDPLPTCRAHLPVFYLFALSYCSWGSPSKNTGLVAISSSSGPCLVSSLHGDLSDLGGPAQRGS